MIECRQEDFDKFLSNQFVREAFQKYFTAGREGSGEKWLKNNPDIVQTVVELARSLNIKFIKDENGQADQKNRERREENRQGPEEP